MNESGYLHALSPRLRALAPLALALALLLPLLEAAHVHAADKTGEVCAVCQHAPGTPAVDTAVPVLPSAAAARADGPPTPAATTPDLRTRPPARGRPAHS